MLKTNLEILEFVNARPGHAADADALAAFIGDAADARLSDLLHAGLLRRSANWYASGPVVYTLTGSGFDSLARGQQQRQQRSDDRADQAAHEARAQHHADRLAEQNRRTMIISGIISAVVSAVMSVLIRLILG